MRQSMQNLMAHHFSLIIDEVLFAEDDFQSYLELLQHCKVYFIAVKPPMKSGRAKGKSPREPFVWDWQEVYTTRCTKIKLLISKSRTPPITLLKKLHK